MANRPLVSRLFSIRLTDAERASLEQRADGRSLGAYIKSRLFADSEPAVPRSSKSPSINRKALASALAALGASRLGSNLNQIAKAANQGALPVTEELETDLRAACTQIAELREHLLLALGVKTTEARHAENPLRDAFMEAAGRPE